MDMNAIEADVDAARCAANRVADVRKRAVALKDAATLIASQDEWALYKKEGEVNQIMEEARTAYEDVSSHRRAVLEATRAHVKVDARAALARRTVESAYKQAGEDTNTVSRLVHQVTQFCRAAREHRSE